MPTLKYWDAGSNQYVAMPGSYGQVYAAVAATPPPAANPVIAPPMGALWVDTSTTPPQPPALAYVPTQAPPPTGNNSFSDAAGELWFSRNGSAWRRASDVVRARAYFNGNYTVPSSTAQQTITYNTLDPGTGDPTGSLNLGTGLFTCPVTGVYMVSGRVYVTLAAATAFFVLITRNGATVARGIQIPAGAGAYEGEVNDQVRGAVGDTLCIQVYQASGQNATSPAGYNELITFAVHFLSPG
jgi:hypothetical protein